MLNSRIQATCYGKIFDVGHDAEEENESILKSMTAKAALKRIGMPDEIAGAAVYLASEAGSFTTGQNIVIDGGESEQ